MLRLAAGTRVVRDFVLRKSTRGQRVHRPLEKLRIALHILPEIAARELLEIRGVFLVREAVARNVIRLQRDRFFQSRAPLRRALARHGFKNAFNSCRRDVILEAVQEHFPELLPFTVACYGDSSTLQFGEFTLFSQEGVQQGDPLGPLYFCLAIHKLLQHANSEFVVGYLDDVTLGGHASIVMADITAIERSAAVLGLILNRVKCEVISSTPLSRQLFQAASVSFTEVGRDDSTLLGSPLSEEGVDRAIIAKRTDLMTLLSRLKYLPAHDSLYLLKSVFAIPKLLFILRTSPCFNSNELLSYDVELRNAMSLLLNVDVNADRWAQASLPVWAGGLGVRSAVTLAPSAFIASMEGAAALVSAILPSSYMHHSDPLLLQAVGRWQSISSDSNLLPPVGATKQREWDTPICESLYARMLANSVDPVSRARLLASRSGGSGDWLHAVPLANIGLHLDNAAVSIAVSLRLGSPAVHEHTCVCGAHVQANGHHGLSCIKSAGRQMRHTCVNDIIHRSLHSAGIHAVREPPGLGGQSNLRPDGVTLLPWSRGKPMMWDFTCPDTLAPSHIPISSATAGAAAEAAERNKLAKYAIFTQQYEVIPIAIETLGSSGCSATSFIEALGRRIMQATGDPRSTMFLRQRISIAIQRGNAASILGTQRHLIPPERVLN